MDDTQQSTQATMSSQQSNAMPATMGDIAGMPGTSAMPGGMSDQSMPTGMTPPPAPAMPTTEFVPAEPVASAMPIASEPTAPVDSSFGTPITPGGVQPVRDVAMTPPPAPTMPTNPIPDPTAVAHETTQSAENADDYSYAEDILSEILDSLDRIEAKLEALEKKQG